jgi:hypothetical protein
MSDKCDACGKPMPCPFCGSERIHLVHFNHWYARCTDCYAQGSQRRHTRPIHRPLERGGSGSEETA